MLDVTGLEEVLEEMPEICILANSLLLLEVIMVNEVILMTVED